MLSGLPRACIRGGVLAGELIATSMNETGSLPRLLPPSSLFVLLFYGPLGSRGLVFPKLGKEAFGWHKE